MLEHDFQKDIDLVWNSDHVYITMITGKWIHFTNLTMMYITSF